MHPRSMISRSFSKNHFNKQLSENTQAEPVYSFLLKCNKKGSQKKRKKSYPSMGIFGSGSETPHISLASELVLKTIRKRIFSSSRALKASYEIKLSGHKYSQSSLVNQQIRYQNGSQVSRLTPSFFQG